MSRRLARIAVPDEAAARERAWNVVRAAYVEREASPRARRRPWPLALAAAGAALVAAAFTPPGTAVIDSIRRAVGVERSEPALFSLPAAGRLLVDSERGAWVVNPDGSRRLLGPYREASWSPHGLYVVATRANDLVALDPNGTVRWSLARAGARLPRWAGSRTDTRIAYIARDGLRIVAGDGTGDRLFAPGERGPLAWRPGERFQLASISAGDLRLRDSGRGVVRWRTKIGAGRVSDLVWSRDGRSLVAVLPRNVVVLDARGSVQRRVSAPGPEFVAAAYAPDGELAYVRRRPGGSSEVVLGKGRRIFSGTGSFSGVAWSPDGRWLLVEWPTANQWVFVRVKGQRRIVAVSGIGRQFGGAFPKVVGWCCR